MGNWKSIQYVNKTGRIIATTTNPVFAPNSGDNMLCLESLYRMSQVTYNFSDDCIYVMVEKIEVD